MKALFAGTFDPPTLGHLDLIIRGSKLFDKVEVAVLEKSTKAGAVLTLQERMGFVSRIVKGMKNVEVVSFSGLIVDFAAERGVDILLRGVRNDSDLDFEMQMAVANRQMTGIETLCLFSSPEYSQINSKLIREIAAGGRGLKPFVPESIVDDVEKLLFQG